MNAGPATPQPAGGGPAPVYSTNTACELATIAAGTGDDRHAATYRKADYWCRTGVFGPRLEEVCGSGNPREWTAEDVLVLAVISRVSDAFARLAVRGAHRPGNVAIYRHVAEQVRAGERRAAVHQLAGHVTLTVDIADIVQALADAGMCVSP